MPELPEVETVVRSIAPITGRRISAPNFAISASFAAATPTRCPRACKAAASSPSQRYGKFIVASIEGGGYLMVHLGMTGRLLLGGAPAKHTHAIFTFDRGDLLYDDSRQFGCIEFSEEFPHRVARLGPEPLEIPFDEFAAELRRAQDANQIAAPQSDFSARRRQYLCG